MMKNKVKSSGRYLILFILLFLISIDAQNQNIDKYIGNFKNFKRIRIDSIYLDSLFNNFKSVKGKNDYPAVITSSLGLYNEESKILPLGIISNDSNDLVYLFMAVKSETNIVKEIHVQVIGYSRSLNNVVKSSSIGSRLFIKKDASIIFMETSHILDDTIYIFSKWNIPDIFVLDNSIYSYNDSGSITGYPIIDVENLEKMSFIKIIIEDSIKNLPPSKFCISKTPLAKGTYERLAKFDKDQKLLLSRAIPYSNNKILAIAITYYQNTNDYYLYYGKCYLKNGVSNGYTCNKTEMRKLTSDNINNWKIELLYTFEHIQINVSKGHKDEKCIDIEVINF